MVRQPGGQANPQAVVGAYQQNPNPNAQPPPVAPRREQTNDYAALFVALIGPPPCSITVWISLDLQGFALWNEPCIGSATPNLRPDCVQYLEPRLLPILNVSQEQHHMKALLGVQGENPLMSIRALSSPFRDSTPWGPFYQHFGSDL